MASNSGPSGATGASGAAVSSASGNSAPSATISQITTTPRIPRGSRSATGSTYQTLSGVRRVKAYPVTRDELFGLGGAGFIATVAFSIGTNYLNRSYDIRKDLELSYGVPPDLKIRWDTRATDDLFFGWIIILIGIAAILAGGAKILSIIRSTDHPIE